MLRWLGCWLACSLIQDAVPGANGWRDVRHDAGAEFMRRSIGPRIPVRIRIEQHLWVNVKHLGLLFFFFLLEGPLRKGGLKVFLCGGGELKKHGDKGNYLADWGLLQRWMIFLTFVRSFQNRAAGVAGSVFCGRRRLCHTARRAAALDGRLEDYGDSHQDLWRPGGIS